MRVLLSAFACAPDTGSEGGVGWDWAQGLAAAGHQVVVLTDCTRAAAIQAYYPQGLPANPRFIFFRPAWLRRIPLNAASAHLLYGLWQCALVPLLLRLHAEWRFDYVHHLTYGVFRLPCFLWLCGAPFVFGPVGGGESVPPALRQGMSYKGRCFEAARDLANWLGRHDPLVHLTLRRACLVLARTPETRAMFPAAIRARTILHQEIGARPGRASIAEILAKPASCAPQLLFAGRLLQLKALHLALPAFARLLRAQPDSVLHVAGDGPMAAQLKAQCALLGIARSVRFHGRLAQNQLFALYREVDGLLFPSLRDSGGNVVVEALSFGLPVICLNLGGPPCFVDASCGRVVEASACDEAAVIDGLSAALLAFSDPGLRRQCALGALARAESLNWQEQFNLTLALIMARIAPAPTGLKSLDQPQV
jgi:glycosyltransferase involved in cell wall biosynthesis